MTLMARKDPVLRMFKQRYFDCSIIVAVVSSDFIGMHDVTPDL